jgi:DNA repair protein RadA
VDLLGSEIDLEDIAGIGPATANKLREGGIYSIEALVVSPIRELSELTGLGLDRLKAVQKEARSRLSIQFVTAEELLEKRQAISKITVGCDSLNELLGGGVETQAITELTGEFGSGKTQICFTLCATVQIPTEEGGLGGSALFIDTEGTFRPERIGQIATARGLDSNAVVKNIVTARAYNSDHQILIANDIDRLIRQNPLKMDKPLRLVVVDSVVSHFRSEFIGRQNLPERQQKLNAHVHKLLRLAEAHNFAVVLTNQVIAQPDVFFGPTQKPAGGHVLAHTCTYRVFLRKSRGNTRVAKIFDSPYLPEMERVFTITERGVEDVESKS